MREISNLKEYHIRRIWFSNVRVAVSIFKRVLNIKPHKKRFEKFLYKEWRRKLINNSINLSSLSFDEYLQYLAEFLCASYIKYKDRK